MLSQFNNPSQELKLRIERLESELVQVKQMILSESTKDENYWWLEIVGSFENDPTFDEAVRFGEEWRKLAE